MPCSHTPRFKTGRTPSLPSGGRRSSADLLRSPLSPLHSPDSQRDAALVAHVPIRCSTRLECGRLVRGRIYTKGHNLSPEHARDQFRRRTCLAATRRSSTRRGIWTRVVRSRCSAAGRRASCRLGLGGAYALGDTLRRALWRSTWRCWFRRCDSSLLKACKVS